ncbi:asparagine synthase (glutamine-hydrolyzing) [Patescibacteria group bacterium]|nr:asparagine synthase (glutamine-hydrolyzing) [Patescibacteria group bacterium]
MCGIAGIWQRDGEPVDSRLLARMGQVLAHRGPDDAGQCIVGSVGLAHRRLSIIDLTAAGHQPMSTPDQRYTIIFNGEIYNYQELAKKYLSGVSLVSNSDTEVLLHLLASQGAAALQLVRGMFALAFWDATEETLLLARDPFGKKPLYYSQSGKALLFASEIKSLLEHPDVSLELDRQQLAKYFLYEYVPAPATGYTDIEQLPMGAFMKVTATTSTIEHYWQLKYLPKSELGEARVTREFDRLLTQAVDRRLISDVPVGLLLSGGLDSTAIGWYMQQGTVAHRHSFSVSFDESTFDESSYARLAARALQTNHHELLFTVDMFRDLVVELTGKMDIPLADASLLPTYAISKLAREHITVALDGDGSDELLGGYGTFTAANVAERLAWLPSGAVGLLEKLASLWPTTLGDFSFDFKIKSFTRGLSYSLARRNQVWLGSFSDIELPQLLTEPWASAAQDVFEDVDGLKEQLAGLSITDQVSLLTINHYLHNDILVKLDRATMFTSLEARTPFLDIDLASFVATLPVEYKRDKALLKKVMRSRIPDKIIDRPKKGFGIPLGYWLKGPLHDWAREVLDTEKLKRDGVLKPAYVTRLLNEHQAGKADHRKKLWTLLAWQLWFDRWITG